jgi:hypothetical protein
MKLPFLFSSVAALGLLAALPAARSPSSNTAPPDTITVFKSPTCGCCADWVDHIREHGFAVIVRDMADVTPVKNASGVPQALRSCHTAKGAGYVFEGHVPADLMARVLRERPTVRGLAVPGMPVGSPGMEAGGRKDPYEVLTFDARGKTTVYAER